MAAILGFQVINIDADVMAGRPQAVARAVNEILTVAGLGDQGAAGVVNFVAAHRLAGSQPFPDKLHRPVAGRGDNLEDLADLGGYFPATIGGPGAIGKTIVGPIFFSLAKIDRGLIEAARDMGASPFQIFREIIGPLSLPGVAIGMIFIFVMIMGEFATAVVVYGGKTSTSGTVILNYYAIANYSFSAVNAIMLMLAMMVGVVFILRIVDIRKEL